MPAKTPDHRPYLRCGTRGATVIEFAIVGPLVLLLLIGFGILTLGVYRYQQVAHLAREGARYASTHGAQYRIDQRLGTGDAATWTKEIRDQAVLPKCSALNAANLIVAASWSAGDNRANPGDPATNFQTTLKNSVTVTVTYPWIPEGYWAGPINLTSSATVPMAF